MAATPKPERPWQVTLAVYLLYLSLGISVMRVLITWVRFGEPGWVGIPAVVFLRPIAELYFQGHLWVIFDRLSLPIAVFFYYMVGTGKNWARISLLIFVILDTLQFTLILVIGTAVSVEPHSKPLDALGITWTGSFLLQPVLQIAAVTLLFRRVSSDWFKAVKIYNLQPEIRSRAWIIKVALGLVGVPILGVVLWQAAHVVRNKELMDAVYRDRVAEVQRLLEKGADIGTKDNLGFPVLLRAAESGSIQCVKLLLAKGADVNNTRSTGGRTALMQASWTGKLAVVKLLLAKGADVDAKDISGETALLSATWTGKPETMRLLLESGADVNAKDKSGQNALIMASGRSFLRDRDEVVRMLLDKGADLNVSDNRGHTPLMAACFHNRIGVVKLLLDNGADVNAKDNQGRTALTLATQKGRTEIREMLKAHGATE